MLSSVPSYALVTRGRMLQRLAPQQVLRPETREEIA